MHEQLPEASAPASASMDALEIDLPSDLYFNISPELSDKYSCQEEYELALLCGKEKSSSYKLQCLVRRRQQRDVLKKFDFIRLEDQLKIMEMFIPADFQSIMSCFEQIQHQSFNDAFNFWPKFCRYFHPSNTEKRIVRHVFDPKYRYDPVQRRDAATLTDEAAKAFCQELFDFLH
jgi:hypothetical protein